MWLWDRERIIARTETVKEKGGYGRAPSAKGKGRSPSYEAMPRREASPPKGAKGPTVATKGREKRRLHSFRPWIDIFARRDMSYKGVPGDRLPREKFEEDIAEGLMEKMSSRLSTGCYRCSFCRRGR